ncbi:MAG: hypothetical protein ACTSUE_11085 [Promethearchaeota archaeon]
MTGKDEKFQGIDNSHRYQIARKISDIGNAITFSFIIGVLFSFGLPQVFPKWFVFLVTFISMIFMPGLFLVLAMKVWGVDFDFTERKSRTPYYLIVEACYITGMIIFSKPLIASWSMFNLSVVSSILNGALTVINLKWKISAHAAGAVGPATGIAIVISPWSLLVTCPLVLAVIWSRLELKKHTPPQLVLGSILAVACYGVVFLGMYPLFLF